ncbi:MAG: glutamate-5-semialdehyde dehydrogenase [Oscillospiraceae bacterium]|jgi:glutamate-5-semialdehyde dehydrogenase|nr:glutamate-5-semialdehyde dehydrogenase [Oscillospiraceae bacterium]
MVRELALAAKAASGAMRLAASRQKDAGLICIAEEIERARPDILAANALDVANADRAGMPKVTQDRLRLDEKRVAAIVAAVRAVAALPDPVGGYDKSMKRPNGLLIGIKRVPLGLVGIIYESRPNVTADAAALCLKSGNAALLRGGKEAINTNIAVVRAIQAGLARAGLPPQAVCLVEDTSRESAAQMMGLTGIIDVLIPRGGAGLIRSVVENARVPVIETGTGNCHVYVDGDADLDMALEIVVNAKVSRPSVCNAAETVLVARSAAQAFLPRMKARLDEYSVELRGCPETAAILGESVVPATREDWETEYLDFILAVRVVDGLSQAAEHINRYGTRHSEAIVTTNVLTASRFTELVDAACVYVNASTRFTDGEEFGFGGEIGISTQKLHARGPMGCEHLTTVQYVIQGEGQVR